MYLGDQYNAMKGSNLSQKEFKSIGMFHLYVSSLHSYYDSTFCYYTDSSSEAYCYASLSSGFFDMIG